MTNPGILRWPGSAMKRNAVCALVSRLSSCAQASRQSGIIATIAGDSNGGGYSGGGYSGGGGPVTSAQMSGPAGLAMDSAGNLYIVDTGNNVIRNVSASGIVKTVVGCGFDAQNGPGSLCLPRLERLVGERFPFFADSRKAKWLLPAGGSYLSAASSQPASGPQPMPEMPARPVLGPGVRSAE